MADPTRDEYVRLAGVALATRGINCHGYDDLLRSPTHREDDFTIPGVDGIFTRTRVRAPLRALLEIRVDGEWDHTTDVRNTDARVGAYTNWQVLHDISQVTGLQLVELVVGGSVYRSAQGLVRDLTRTGQDAPHLWNGVLELLLPDGTLL